MLKNVSLLHSDTNKMLSLFNIPFVLLSSPEHKVLKGKLLGYVIVSHLPSVINICLQMTSPPKPSQECFSLVLFHNP